MLTLRENLRVTPRSHDLQLLRALDAELLSRADITQNFRITLQFRELCLLEAPYANTLLALTPSPPETP